MYSQQEKVKKCRPCEENGQNTLILWKPHPDKIGQIKPETGRPYMKAWDVNASTWHNCQFYKPGATYGAAASTTTTTTKPPFTANDNTAKLILAELEGIKKISEQMVEYLEVLAQSAIKTGITPANEVSLSVDGKDHRQMPPQNEHQNYQNNTTYEIE